MLVLTRKAGEGVVIGNDITITFIEARGNAIRIGIDAPRETKIYRKEVYDRISQENKEASQWSIADLDALNVEITPKGEQK